eukprot:8873471-Alexandrium_andersonii.AAC.1
MWRLLNILSVFRCKAYVLTSDLQRFAMDTKKNPDQLNALVSYITLNSSVALRDGRNFWGDLRQFCVTHKGHPSIDVWHHGDEGM